MIYLLCADLVEEYCFLSSEEKNNTALSDKLPDANTVLV